MGYGPTENETPLERLLRREMMHREDLKDLNEVTTTK